MAASTTTKLGGTKKGPGFKLITPMKDVHGSKQAPKQARKSV